MEAPVHGPQIALQGRLKVAMVVIATITIEAMITKILIDQKLQTRRYEVNKLSKQTLSVFYKNE